MEEKINTFRNKLLEWHKENAFSYPWRETKDAYKVLIAEVLLRKTTREQVRKVFCKLIAKYPNSDSLAVANAGELEELVKSLGMQKKRTEVLIKASRFIVKRFRGLVPSEAEKLLEVPGVGLYTANAVMCFAFHKQVPLVDTNVIRIICRVFGIKSKKARLRTDPEIWNFVGRLIPRGKARDFNFALIDFASAVCTSRAPKCNVCFASGTCCFKRGKEKMYALK